MRTESRGEFLMGRGDRILARPFDELRREIEAMESTRSPRLGFMTSEHHWVRDFAVVEIPRYGSALPPERVAEGTGLPLARVESVLSELESRLFFLVRDGERRVSWAFPVTSERTAHRLELSTGEAVHAA
jgi:hypothetical protein